jgi:hypothetical protein
VTGYPLLDIFLSTLYFFGWFLWLMLMFWIISDIFRSDDLSGWAKAVWLVGVIILPLVGILVYLIARGGSMRERQVARQQAADAQFRAYVRDAAASDSGSQADELAKLASLHQRGVLNDQEFEQARSRVR